MIPAEYYHIIYLLFVLSLTLVGVVWYSVSNNQFNVKSQIFSSLIVTILMIVFIGLRPISEVFVDMPGYALAMLDQRYERLEESYNFLFDPMMAWLSSHGASMQTPIILLSIIYFGGISLSCYKLFSKNTFLAILIYWGAFSTFSYGVNGIKAGAAAAFFLCALGYKDNKWICFLFLILSLGFHHAMILPVIAFVICNIIKSNRAYFLIWILSLIIAILHITFFQSLFAGLVDEHGAGYLMPGSGAFVSGFRADFILYSALPLLLGNYFIEFLGYTSKKYALILNTYTLANSVWMLCMYASFTNRIAYLSWLMYPIVLFFPFFDSTHIATGKKRICSWLILFHLAFTFLLFFRG